jgi:hypothetical protein
MKYDTSVVRELQNRYQQGEPRMLTLLYVELKRMAVLLLKDMRVQESIDNYSHEAASRIVERYIENPAYKMGPFSLRQECIKAAHGGYLNPSVVHPSRPKAQAHTAWIALDNIRIPIPDVIANEDDQALIDGLSLYFSHWKWYRPAIRTLMAYIPKSWMLSHAVQLREIFLKVNKK